MYVSGGAPMRKSFKDSLKVLEADIQHANTLYMLMAPPLCPLMREKQALEFYAVIYPSLLQLQRGVTDSEDKKQKAVCMERYRRKDEEEHRHCSELDIEREEECGICMEMNSKIVLPNCNHAMCLKCYREWRSRSQSCPFCRDSLKRTNSGDLWVFLDSRDVVDMTSITRENLKRLFMYIDKLPLIVPDTLFDAYDTHVR
ncbi:E3 ubiquitin-protein ligase AIRP2 [Sesamum angolense]|uniref:E3 ubiquitin-protein ligase AIRP2 n=1 Tax=Sesamum angolense TaxID=2727404 RepID=A0AAE1WSX0_9LAMI|nr:E3 ubiquitin-protein ligase AIRP2 [Sesamum angolense]